MSEDPRVLVGALGWSADLIVDLLPDEPPEPVDLQPWGLNAGADPVTYRFWLERHGTAAGPPAAVDEGGPLVSVVMPVYRPELWYFEECIASVRAQHYTKWELCLCDDASGDAALTRTLQHLESSDPRVKVVVHERNLGISGATNSALARATGEFVALMDHDDLLEPDALSEVVDAIRRDPQADVVYTDDDKLDEQQHRYDPYFKPDWAPDLLLSYPYLGHLTVVRRSLLDSVGGFRSEFDGSQDYDVMLRATELARSVVHVPKVLYHWRAVSGSAAGDAQAKPWAHEASRRVLEEAVSRRGLDAVVEKTAFPGIYNLRRSVHGTPRVALIVPFRDGADLTARCLGSLAVAPGYDHYEVVLVDNGSTEPETLALLDRASAQGARVLEYPGEFNWSSINNLAARNTDAELLLFMNNDVEARSDGWLHALVELAQLPDVGAAGARLVYPDGTVQHAGVVLGMSGIANHIFCGLPPGNLGYCLWDRVVRPYSALTGACLMTRHDVFDDLGMFDEGLSVAFNDVDYCMRLNDAGLRVLYTPHAELVHYESVSRGMSGFMSDTRRFFEKWDRERLRDDPYYNQNLSRFEPWCPVRQPGEDERWDGFIDDLTVG